jgi:hypothetical protein
LRKPLALNDLWAYHWRHFSQRSQEAAQPEDVTLFRGKGFGLSPDDFAHPADCL